MRSLLHPLACLLIASAGCPTLGGRQPPRFDTQEASTPYRGQSFEVLSRPVKLGYGQVFNTVQEPIPLPADLVDTFAKGRFAVTGYKSEVVKMDEEGNSLGSAALFDCYLHHYGSFLAKKDDLQLFYTNVQAAGVSLSAAYGRAPAVNAMSHNLAAMYKLHTGGKAKGSAVAGGGSGAEARGTVHAYPAPYGLILEEGVNALVPMMHLINTRGSVAAGEDYSRLAECPCSSDRIIDRTNGTIDGQIPKVGFHCNAEMTLEGNSGCSLDTYSHGLRCCEHDVFVSEKADRQAHPEVSIFGMKFTFYYEAVTPVTVAMRAPHGFLDVTGSLGSPGQVEYDIKQCAPGEECLHTAVARQYLDVPMPGMFPASGGVTEQDRADIAAGRQVDIIYAVGHQHLGGASPLGIKLFKDSTNELLCHSTPIYGRGDQAGDEKHYVVGMTSCIFGGAGPDNAGGKGTPPRLRRDDVMRIESTYNSTNAHYGVMSLFFLQLAEVPLPGASSRNNPSALVL